MDKNFFNFNKQIIFGELGSIIGAPSFTYIATFFTKNPNWISISAVAGSLIGAAILWLITRIYDEKKRNRYEIKTLATDIVYYTPVATPLVFLVYQPLLFFLTRVFLGAGLYSLIAVIIAQFIAFLSFLILINLYRLFLIKRFKIEL